MPRSRHGSKGRSGGRVLLYAAVDMNLIDGSSVWVSSVIEMLLCRPGLALTLLLRRPVERDLLTGPLASRPGVTLIDPWKAFADCAAEPWFRRRRLDDAGALMLLRRVQTRDPHDVLFVRAPAVALGLAADDALAGRTWAYLLGTIDDEAKARDLQVLRARLGRLFCQTEALRDHYRAHIGALADGIEILPPMIPDYLGQPPPMRAAGRRLVYVGKLDAQYNAEPMLDAFVQLRARLPDAELHVAGDKFHIPPGDPGFADRVRARLEGTDGVCWHGALPRAGVEALVARCDVCVGWRTEELNQSLELSTKALEYGRLGKPVLLNRHVLHEGLLGADYPAFVNSAAEFVTRVAALLEEPETYRRAATRLHEACRPFTYRQVCARLFDTPPALVPAAVTAATLARLRTVVFAGHDFRFATPLIDHFRAAPGFRVLLDSWRSHTRHDEPHSRHCLEQADVVVCEWGLGNAVWYSRHRRAGQKLIVRVHAQELRTVHVDQYTLRQIDRIVCIAPQVMRRLEQEKRIPRDKLTLIYNLVDGASLALPKLPEAEYNLGLLGFCPRMKRLDRALDIFEALWTRDRRFVLRVKGNMPTEYDWLWSRPDERAYYEAAIRRINRASWRDAVSFEGYGSGVEQWFAQLGFILSTSDHEGSHQAVAEGMCAGCVPVMLNWEGAGEIYPPDLVFPDTSTAAAFIGQCVADKRWSVLAAEAQAYAMPRFDQRVVLERWREEIGSVDGPRAGGT